MNPTNESITGQIWKWACIIAVILVSIMLFSNLVGLLLSFPPVFEDSPKVYRSGMSGSMDMPYLPEDHSSFDIDIVDEITEGDPIEVTVSTRSGNVPSMPMYISFDPSTGGSIEYDLHDHIDEDGNWSGVTVIPGDLPVGVFEIGLGFKGQSSNISIGNVDLSIELLPSQDPFVLIDVENDLQIMENLVIFIEGHTSSSFSIVTALPIAHSPIQMILGSEGSFGLDPNMTGLSGWERMKFKIDLQDGSELTTDSYLLNFRKGDQKISEFTLSKPFHDRDELHRQDGDEIITEEDEEIVLLTNTYYDLDMKLDGAGPFDILFDDGYPIPETRVLASFEGHSAHVRPVDGERSYRCTFRTIGGYNDDPDDGLIISTGEPGKNMTILQKDIIFKERQSPGFQIDPDPFSIENAFPDPLIITIYEGWELVSYREIKDTPEISIDDNDVQVFEGRSRETPDDASTSFYANIPSNGSLGGQVLETDIDADFQMEVTISFIFFYLPIQPVGAGVPIWFTLISIAIITSLALISIKSLSHGVIPWDKKRRIVHPFRSDSDIMVLSGTFAAALFFSWTVVLLFNMLEQPTPVPGILSDRTPIWIRMILLADASVWEEVVTRVMFIGLPLLFLHPSRKWNLDRFKVLLGGQGKFGRAEVILILVSSSFFGLAHLGWGPWKVIPTFVSGALFGYLYIKIGLHASIAMHFLFDYDSFIFDILEIPYYHLGVIYYFALLVGGFFLAYLLVQVKRWFEYRSNRRLDPKWSLVLHSGLTVLLITSLVISDADPYLILILSMVPFLEAGGFFLHRSGRRKLGKAFVAVGSLFTLALAPIGLMWCFEESS